MISSIDTIKTVNILGIPFNDMSYEEVRKSLYKMFVSAGAHHIVLANAHTLNVAYSNREYHRALQRASLVLRDGIGVKLASILAGQPLRSNFVGTDFIPRLLGDLCTEALGVFLFGAKP